jgi:hypothetical protein
MLGSARPQVRVGVPSTPLGQSSLGDRDQARAAGAGRDLGIPAAVADDLLKGHLSQRCPVCGITEAAGGYCTKCDRRTGPADWFRGTSRKTQGDASRARVHSTAETGATALETANPERLALWEAAIGWPA